MAETGNYRNGSDLILSIPVSTVQTALGHSDECKFSFKADTNSRQTKENSNAMWDEKTVKKMSCTITATGFVNSGDDAGAGLPNLMTLFLAHTPFTASWNYRDGGTVNHYTGTFIMTQLEDEGKAGDDEKYSFTLESSGEVTKAPAA